MTSDLVAAAAGGVFALATGVVGPAVVARMPEPELEEKPAEGEEEKASRLTIKPAYSKVAYADLARRPRLALWLALGSCLAGALLGFELGWSRDLLVVLPVVPVGVWLGYVDWQTTFLPTRIIWTTYALLALVVVVISAISGDGDDAVRAAAGSAIYGGLFYLMWWITPGFGFGDVRLGTLLGLGLGWLGWPALLLGFMGGLFLGGFGGGLLALLKVIDARRNPFGPYMLVAAGLAAAYGQAFADWRGL